MNLTQELKKRYFVGLGLIAVLSTLSQGVIQYFLSKQKNESFIINSSGRQRMLSQKILQEILTISENIEKEQVHERLKETVKEFKSSHQSLIHRDKGIFSGENSLQIKRLFSKINPFYLEIVQVADCFIEKRNFCENRDFEKILKASSQFLIIMDLIVFEYERNLSNKIFRLRILEIILYILLILVLFLEVLFIFYPAIKIVKMSIKSVEEEKEKSANSFKMVALGEMAAGVAHEINNPLAILRTRSEMIEKKIEIRKITLEQISDEMKKMIATVDRIASIVQGLLRVARNESLGKLESIFLKEVIADTLAISKDHIKNNGIELIELNTNTEAIISGKTVSLSQVLLNLLSNACYVSKDSLEKKIIVEVRDSESKVEVRIKNTGEKISEDISKRIFDPFFTTKPVGKGTGLGLSVSRSLMNEIGGELFVDQSEKLTTFVISIPKEN